jgi:hypothetical protein
MMENPRCLLLFILVSTFQASIGVSMAEGKNGAGGRSKSGEERLPTRNSLRISRVELAWKCPSLQSRWIHWM